jgi:hypothetical protein
METLYSGRCFTISLGDKMRNYGILVLTFKDSAAEEGISAYIHPPTHQYMLVAHSISGKKFNS